MPVQLDRLEKKVQMLAEFCAAARESIGKDGHRHYLNASRFTILNKLISGGLPPFLCSHIYRKAFSAIVEQFAEVGCDLLHYVSDDQLRQTIYKKFSSLDYEEHLQAVAERNAHYETAPVLSPSVPVVVMKQEAVGHGGFHHGVMGVESPSFRWVYDCGSRNVEVLKTRIERLAARAIRSDRDCEAFRGKIDILFLSHFDYDHVSGLDELFSRFDVDTAVVPYLSNAMTFSVVAKLAAVEELSATMIELVVEPESFFRRRGVRRIVRILPETDREDRGEPTRRSLPTIDVRFDPKEGADESKILTALSDSESSSLRSRLSRGINSVVMSSGSAIYTGRDGMTTDWMFLMYSHGWKKESSLVIEAAERLVGVSVDRKRFPSALAKYLRNVVDSHRDSYGKVLKKLFFDRRHSNGVSLSVYAGPRPLSQVRTDSKNVELHRPGFLLTGDSVLTSSRVKPWLETFSPILQSVGCTMLPHHGSRDGFCAEFAKSLSGSKFFLTACEREAPADDSGIGLFDPEDKRRVRRPSRIVCEELLKLGVSWTVVTETSPGIKLASGSVDVMNGDAADIEFNRRTEEKRSEFWEKAMLW